jgi:hypothetical protein
MTPTVLVPTESAEQQAVVRWWAMISGTYGLSEKVLMACPAQAARSPRGGARMKAEGYRAGTPDLFLATARNGCHGLFIEMKKRDGGKLSDSQKEMSFELGEQGYRTAVAYGAEAARAIITEYLKPSP